MSSKASKSKTSNREGPKAERGKLAQLRALELVQTEINFIPNREFCCEDPFSRDQGIEAMLKVKMSARGPEVDLPAHLRRMCDSELLSPEAERAFFREMNLLKYQANVIKSQIDPEQVEPAHLDKLEALLTEAHQIRDYLIKANMRLVISIVKKFVTPQQSFDELLSEGIMTLMKTVDKFDFDRGFRFSTYAYRSIFRHVYRTVAVAQKEEARFTRDAEEWAFQDTETASSSLVNDQFWGNLRQLLSALLDQLDRRETFIIRSRYALGAHRKVRTFQYLADKLGVSKERVRQLERRAVSKLQSLADKMEHDEMFPATMT